MLKNRIEKLESKLIPHSDHHLTVCISNSEGNNCEGADIIFEFVGVEDVQDKKIPIIAELNCISSNSI